MIITFKLTETNRFTIQAELLHASQCISISGPDDKDIVDLFRRLKEPGYVKSTNTMWFYKFNSDHGDIVHEFDIFRMDTVTCLTLNDFVVDLTDKQFQIDPHGNSEKIAFAIQERIAYTISKFREFCKQKYTITLHTPIVQLKSDPILKPAASAIIEFLKNNKYTEPLPHKQTGIINPTNDSYCIKPVLTSAGEILKAAEKVEELNSGVEFSYMTDEDEIKAETINTENLTVEHFDSVNDQDVPIRMCNVLTPDEPTADSNMDDVKEKLAPVLATSLSEQWISEQNCVTLDSISEDLIVDAEKMEKLATGVLSELEEEFSPEQNYIKFVLINRPVWNNASLQSLYKTGVQEYLDSPDHKVFIDFRENLWIQELLASIFTDPIHKDRPFKRHFTGRNAVYATEVEFLIRESEKFIARVHFNDEVGVGCITINRDVECLNYLVDFITTSK